MTKNTKKSKNTGSPIKLGMTVTYGSLIKDFKDDKSLVIPAKAGIQEVFLFSLIVDFRNYN